MQNLLVTLLGILIILLPSNLGKHFVNPSSYVNGNLIDYLVPTFYLTDLLVIAIIFLIVFTRLRQRLATIDLIRRVALVFLIIFALLLIVNVLFFPNLSAVYKLGRLLLYLLLTLSLATYVFSRRDVYKLANYLSLAILGQCLLALWQFIFQRSLCGYLCLGETTLSPFSYGVARDFIGGFFLILPYGTFPHPNILGGFLAISLPMMLYFFLAIRKRRFIVTLYLALMVLLLTKSQAAILVGVLGVFTLTLHFVIPGDATRDPVNRLKNLSGVLLSFPNSWLASVSFWRRLQLADISFRMITDKPWWGVGLNQFIPELYSYGYISSWPAFLQPVHNIYLLIGAELGLPALLIFLLLVSCFLIFLLRYHRYLLMLTLLQLMALGFWDHYLWTTPQGLLTLWLTLGFSLTIIKTSHETIKTA